MAPVGCWSGTIGTQWGTWPYQQIVYDNTYWCSNGSDISYRSTTVTTSMFLCRTDSTFTYLVASTLGYRVYMAGANFSCPTPVPYIVFHTMREEQDTVNAWGNIYRGPTN